MDASGESSHTPGILLGALFMAAALFACGDGTAPLPALESDSGTDMADSQGELTREPESAVTVESDRTSTDAALSQTCDSRIRDEAALVALYDATDGANWTNNANWLTDAPLDDWAGVSGNEVTRDGNVVSECVIVLALRSNGLRGELPPELGSLLNLEVLDLAGNQLSGKIPPELGRIPNLQFLELAGGQLSGKIPPELGSLLDLQRLDLAGNQLSGEIPPQLGNLTNLINLSLAGNQLSGEISPQLGRIPDLLVLDLAGNQLSGEIPPELGGVAVVNLENNRLTESVLRPSDEAHLAQLTDSDPSEAQPEDRSSAATPTDTPEATQAPASLESSTPEEPLASSTTSSSETSPTETSPTETAPTETAPTETAPTETSPTETSPTETPSTASRDLVFREGGTTRRSIPENTPAGINVGVPVSAEGDSTLAYTISGPDATDFTIVPTTGQIRTREGVSYDYETKSRYMVGVGVANDSGATATIDVTIHIEDLTAACQSLLNRRTNHGDGYVTVKWNRTQQRQGRARILGYQVEMRRGDEEAWTDQRTLYGRDIDATIYEDLINLQQYWFRIRPINTESDCRWSPPFLGIPTTYLGPIYPIDRFSTRPVGSPDHYWQFVTQDRCRYSADSLTLDANCTYEYTGPDTSRIVLEFDDPSRGSCAIGLAFSSLTAGSFLDDCLDADVNTEVPFDTSFRMPRSGPQSESETDVPRAPRSQEEFDVFVWGRDDLIPGLLFRCLGPEAQPDCAFTPGTAWRVAGQDPDTGLPIYKIGSYAYRNNGPSRGELTYVDAGDGGKTVFNLEFEPSGKVRATVTDGDNNLTTWLGMPHLDPELGLPLPIPSAWWESVAIESDFAPRDWDGLESRVPTPRHPAIPEAPRDNLLQRTLLGRFGELGLVDHLPSHRFGYDKVGRNRAVVTIDFRSWCEQHPELCLDESQEGLAFSVWSFDFTFTSEQAARYTLTVERAGQVPLVKEGFADFNGNNINLSEFPEEVLPPIAPPQASGIDVSGVEIAASISASEISGADVQTFLISDQGVQSAAYQPGDWLEPKDGSNQRMMVVGVSQATAAASSPASRQPAQATAMGYLPGLPSLAIVEFAAFEPTITQLSVVCMQKDHRIPTRGARYFSQPETAEGPVQTCQRNCVLDETSNIQECVWKCEEN